MKADKKAPKNLSGFQKRPKKAYKNPEKRTKKKTRKEVESRIVYVFGSELRLGLFLATKKNHGPAHVGPYVHTLSSYVCPVAVLIRSEILPLIEQTRRTLFFLH